MLMKYSGNTYAFIEILLNTPITCVIWTHFLKSSHIWGVSGVSHDTSLQVLGVSSLRSSAVVHTAVYHVVTLTSSVVIMMLEH